MSQRVELPIPGRHISQGLQQDSASELSNNFRNMYDEDSEEPNEKSIEEPDTTNNSIETIDSKDMDTNTDTSKTNLDLPIKVHGPVVKSWNPLRSNFKGNYNYDNLESSLNTNEPNNWEIYLSGNSNERDDIESNLQLEDDLHLYNKNNNKIRKNALRVSPYTVVHNNNNVNNNNNAPDVYNNNNINNVVDSNSRDTRCWFFFCF